ncbi:MAG TPA: EamA family transporter [Candidatus Nanopelagicaceae bacterium]
MSSRRAYLLLLSAALFYAINGIASKWVMEAGLSPWRLTEVRTAGALVALIIYLAFKGHLPQLRPAKGEMKLLLLFGIVGIAAVQSFYFFSILKLHVSIALIIEFTAPIWIVLYLRFVKKVKIANSMWLGLIAAFVGLILVGEVWKGLTLNGLGVLSSFLDALSLATYFVLGRTLGKIRSTETMLVWGFGITSILYAIVKPWWSFPFHIFKEEIELNGRFAGHHMPGWLLITFIILIGTIIPYLCVLTGVNALSSQVASIIGMLEPVLAGVFGWVLLNETFTTIQLIGAVVVLIGIFIANEKITNEKIPEGSNALG